MSDKVLCFRCARRPSRLGRLDYCEACARLTADTVRSRRDAAIARIDAAARAESAAEPPATFPNDTYERDREYQKRWHDARKALLRTARLARAAKRADALPTGTARKTA